MKKHIVVILLSCILLLGAGLRLWQLGSVPLSPDWDEVALGYDAHSLFTTGRDEFGAFLPPVLRSFDDYKPALYAYLAIPTVEMFGLTVFATRLPSAIMGILAIWGLYLLVKELFKRGEANYLHVEILALLSAFLLAISPWHLQFSRVAFETNVGLTFNIFVALFFLKGLKKPWYLALSMLLAGLNLSVYQSERVFTPLFVLALLIIFWKEVMKIAKKYLFIAFIVGLITVIPMFFYFASNARSLIRVEATSIFSNQTNLLQGTIPRLQNDTTRHDALGLLFDNRRVVYTKTIVDAFLIHYMPNWLFIQGDNDRHHAPGMGLLYLFTLPFLLIGIYQLVFGKYDRKTKYFIFAWLIIAPIPASITFEVPHAVRTLNILPTFILLSALGLVTSYYAMQSWPNRFIRYAFFAVFIIFTTWNISYFLNQYFVQQNYFFAYDWQYGYQPTIAALQSIEGNYKKIIVSDQLPMDKSYMFFLFYLNYPPQAYQALAGNSSGSFQYTHHFGKYEFHTFTWDKKSLDPNNLYIGTPKDFPTKIVARKTIYYPDGSPAMYIVDPKDNSL